MNVCKKDWGEELESLTDAQFDELLEHSDECPIHAAQVDEYLAEITPLLRSASPETGVSIYSVGPVRKLGVIDYVRAYFNGLVLRVHPHVMNYFESDPIWVTVRRQYAMHALVFILLVSTGVFATMWFRELQTNPPAAESQGAAIAVDQTQSQSQPVIPAKASGQEIAVSPRVEPRPTPLPVMRTKKLNPLEADTSRVDIFFNGNIDPVSSEALVSPAEILKQSLSKESTFVRWEKPSDDESYAKFSFVFSEPPKKQRNPLCIVELTRDSKEAMTTTPDKEGSCTFVLKVGEEYMLTLAAKGYQQYRSTFSVKTPEDRQVTAIMEQKKK